MNLPLLPHPNCTACNLSALGCRTPGMATVPFSVKGLPTAILFLGKWPSSVEDRTGQPHTGSEGQVLRGPMMEGPWPGCPSLPDRADIYLGNALRCWPKGLKDFTPKPAHLNACRQHLDADLKALSGYERLILVLAGAEPCRMVLGQSVTAAIRSNPHQIDHRTLAVATYNPAILSRDPSLWSVINDHLWLLHRLLDGDLPSPEPVIVEARRPTPDDPRTISYDIETYGAVRHLRSGADAPQQTVFHPARMTDADGIAKADICQTWAITLAASDLRPSVSMTGDFSEPSLAILSAWLDHADTIIGFNLQFDALVTRHCYGPLINERHILIDGQVANYLDSEVRVERSLKNLGHILGTHTYEGEQTAEGRFESSDDPFIRLYNARDTHRSLIVVAELIRRISLDSPTRWSPSVVQHFSDTLWTAISMSESGVPCDPAALRRLCDDYTQRIADLEASAPFPLAGKGSAKARDALYLDAASRCPVRLKSTKTKAISSSKNNRLLLEQHLQPNDPALPAIRLISQHDRLRKILSSYLTKYLHHPRERHINGVLYPTWWIVPSSYDSGEDGGTLGSRFSAKNPAIQTWPSEVEAILRSRYPGSSLGWPDLGQIEWRVAGVLSGDPAIAEECRASDPHTIAARIIYGESALVAKYGPNYATAKAFRSFERQCGKHSRFTRLNLGSPKVIQSTILKLGGLDLPLDECVSIHRRLSEAYAKLAEWQTRFIAEVCVSRVIELPFTGHTRRFYGPSDLIESTMAPNIVNFPIQGIAALILQAIQVRIRRTAPDIHQCFQTHDSLCMDHPDPAVPREAWTEAVHFVEQSGYWSLICNHYGHFIPLAYEWKSVGSHLTLTPPPLNCPFVPTR